MRRRWRGMVAALGLLGLPCGAAAQPVTPGYRIQTVASGLDTPWSVAVLPDGRALVTERAGRIKLVDPGGQPSRSLTGVPAVYENSQGGLFDVVLHPAFATNSLLYLSYAAGTRGRNFTRVTRYRLDGLALVEGRTIFESAPKDTPVHYGGRMAFLRDGTLVVTVGDGFDYREKAQDTAVLLGKLVRLRDTGDIPADNPLVRRPGADPRILSWGHRNPQGLALDPATGRLWEHEHGPRGGDEVNLIVAGGNYGWPVATRGRDYSGATISPFATYPGMRDAAVVWVPSIAPSGLAVYRGRMFPELDGDLLVGALVSKEVRRVDLDAAGRVLGQGRVFPEIAARVRDVRVAADGAIWVTTDGSKGRVYRVSR